jgi:hypothetical protein
MLDLSKLKPSDDTATEIAASLDRITAARAEAEAALIAARDNREQLLLEGSAREIKAAEQAAADAALDIERLGLLEAQIAPTLEPARERERQAAHDAAVAEFDAALEANTATWNREIPKLTKAIDKLAEERRALATRARELGLRDVADQIDLDTRDQPSTATMREEAKEAARLAQLEANRIEAERREQRRRQWEEQSRAYDERQRAAEAEAAARGYPSPVRIITGAA